MIRSDRMIVVGGSKSEMRGAIRVSRANDRSKHAHSFARFDPNARVNVGRHLSAETSKPVFDAVARRAPISPRSFLLFRRRLEDRHVLFYFAAITANNPAVQIAQPISESVAPLIG